MQQYLNKTTKTLKSHLAIEFDNVTYKFGQLTVLDKVSFKIDKGDFLYIIGPNGAGKTTLVKILSNFLLPYEGKVTTNIVSKGLLPQYFGGKTNFPITVNEVIYTGFKNQKLIITKEDRETINYWLNKMQIPEIGNKQISHLSGGQMQRVFFIRSIISNPELLILDEPTSSLDASFRKAFYEIIDELNKQGMTIIFITHDIHESLTDDRLILELDQRVRFFGKSSVYRNNHQEVCHV